MKLQICSVIKLASVLRETTKNVFSLRASNSANAREELRE